MTWEHAGHEVNVTETESRTHFTVWITGKNALHLFDSTAGEGEGDYKAHCQTCGEDDLPIPDDVELWF